MNNIFRIVWSEATQTWVAVSELTKAHKKKGSAKNIAAASMIALATLGASNSVLAAVASDGQEFGGVLDGKSLTKTIKGQLSGGEGLVIGGAGTEAKGNTNTVAIGADTVAYSSSSVAIAGGKTGAGDKATDQLSKAKNKQTVTLDELKKQNSNASDSSVALAWTVAKGLGAVAIGGDGGYADGHYSVAIGLGKAEGIQAVALANSIAKGDGAFAVSGGKAEGNHTMALGTGAQALKNGAMAFGLNSNAREINALGFGNNAYANADSSIAIGSGESIPLAFLDPNNANGSMTTTAAVAGGKRSIAMGRFARAGQDDTIAIGANASTQGKSAVAIGGYGVSEAGKEGEGKSVAEAYKENSENAAQAYADYAVAVGYKATANQANAVAISESYAGGQRAVAAGKSNAYGNDTVALAGSTANTAQASKANTVAIGGSTAKGENTVAIGGSNAYTDGSFAAAGGNTATMDPSALGGDRAATATGGTGKNQVAIGGGSNSNGEGSVAIGGASQAVGDNSIAMAGGKAVAQNGVALGKSTAGGINAFAASGGQATENHAIAIGHATASSVQAIALGDQAKASEQHAVAIGLSTDAGLNALAAGNNAKALSQGAVALGFNSKAGGTYYSLVNKNGKNEKVYADPAQTSTAIGYNADATPGSSVAIGGGATIHNGFSVALGNGAVAGTKDKSDFAGSTAIGQGAQATGNYSTAVGKDAKTGDFGSALGKLANAAGTAGVAVGTYAETNGYSSIAIGGPKLPASGNVSVDDSGKDDDAKTKATADESIAVGAGAQATDTHAIALGFSAKANKKDGVALGASSVTTADKNNDANAGRFAKNNDRTNKYEGLKGVAATSALAGVSVGSTTQTRQINNLSAGTRDTDAVNVAQLRDVNLAVSGDGNTKGDVRLYDQTLQIVGGDNVTTKVEGNKVTISATVPVVGASQSIKYFSVKSSGGGNENNEGATGNDAIAIGKNAQSQANGAIAMGWTAVVDANAGDSIAIGSSTQTKASETIAMGKGAKAQAQKATAIGTGANSVSNSSIALGEGATINGGAVNDTSHSAIAIGRIAKASGLNSIALGVNTETKETKSVAIGSDTKTGGANATAVGAGANAATANSIAMGNNTLAGVARSAADQAKFDTLRTALGNQEYTQDINDTSLQNSAQYVSKYRLAVQKLTAPEKEELKKVGIDVAKLQEEAAKMTVENLGTVAHTEMDKVAKLSSSLRDLTSAANSYNDPKNTDKVVSRIYLTQYQRAVKNLTDAEKAILEKQGIDIAALQEEAAKMTVDTATHTEMDKVTKLFGNTYSTLKDLVSAADSYNSRASAATANGDAVTKAKQAVDTAQAELDKLTGTVAIGNASAASGERATAIGIGATATGTNSLALGYGSAVEFSVNSKANNAKGSTAIGQNARVQDSANSIALGTGAMIGVHEQGQPRTNTHDSIAIGSGANTLGSQNIVIGKNASAFSSRTDLNNVIHTDVNAVAIGTNAYVFDSAGVAIGQGARVNSYGRIIGAIGGVALGGGSVSDRQNSLANLQTISFDGYKPEATRERKYITNFDPYTARNNTNVAEYNMSEYSTLVATAGAVSVGDSSTTHEVSISGTKVLAPITRQIINVAAGDNDSDAVNVAQLKSVNLKVVADSRNYQGEGGGRNFGNTNSDGSNLFLDREVLNIAGDSSSFTTTESKFVTITDSNKAKDGLEAGATGKKSPESYLQVKVKNTMAKVTVGTDGKAKYTTPATQTTPASNGLVSGDTLNNIANNIFWTLKSDDDSRNTEAGELKVKAGTQVALKDSTNLTVTHTKNGSEAQYSFDLRPDVTLGTAKTGNKDGTAGSVTVNGGSGQIVKINGSDGSLTLTGETKIDTNGKNNPETKTVVNDKGITITPVLTQNANGTYSPSKNSPVSLTQNGLDNGGNKIINVAPGVADTDAVNVSQLNAWKVKYFSVNSTDGVNEDNKGAKGTDSIAIGKNANTDSANKDNGSRNMAIGNGATVTVLKNLPKVDNTDEDDKSKIVTDAIALGTNATTSAKDTVVIGHGANATGEASVSVGLEAATGGSRNIAIGKNASVKAGNGTGEAVNTNDMIDSIAIGTSAKASAKNTIVIGNGAQSIRANRSYQTGENTIAIGTGADASYTHSIAMGTGAKVGMTESVAIGNQAKGNVRANGNGKASTAVGARTEAEGDNAVAVGVLTKATAGNAAAFGTSAVASGGNSTAIGYAASAAGLNTVAIGDSAQASFERSIAIGKSAVANTTNTMAIGEQAQSTGIRSMAFGRKAQSIGENSIAFGSSMNDNASEMNNRTFTMGNRAVAFGTAASALTDSAIAMGDNATAGGTDAQGDALLKAYNDLQTAQANKAKADAMTAGTAKDEAVAKATTALADAQTKYNEASAAVNKHTNTVAIGKNAVSAGISTVALGDTAKVLADADRSVALGNAAQVGEKSTDSVAIGTKAKVEANAINAVAMGNTATVKKNNGVAIGNTATVNNENGTAIGNGATISADRGTAIGQGTSVSTNDGVALGAGSSASVAAGTQAFDPAKNRTNFYSEVRGTGAAAKSARGAVDIGGRQITSVAGGTADTDAVNVAQLKGVALGFTGNSGKGDVRLYDQDLAVVGAGSGDSQYIKTTASDKKIEIDLTDRAKRAIDNKISLGGDTGTTDEIKLSNEGGIKFNVKGATTGTGKAATSYITTNASGSDVTIDLSDDAKNKLNRTYNVVAGSENVQVEPKTENNVTTFTVKVDPNEISAGKNISITGEGTTTNPYMITAKDQVESVTTSTAATGDENIATITMMDNTNDKSANARYGVGVSKKKVADIAKEASAWKVQTNGNTEQTVQGGDTVTFIDGQNIKITNDGKKITVATDKNITADTVKVGKDGKDGVDGTIGVNGKDGASVVINGKDGSIGLTGPKGENGKDGATTTINVAPGRDGKDGAPGTKGLDGKITTRIEYKDGNNTHTIATLDDGLRFTGNNTDKVNKNKLNTLVTVKGEGVTADQAKTFSSASGNINVVANGKDGDESALEIQLAKTLKNLEGVESKSITLTGGDNNSKPITITNNAGDRITYTTTTPGENGGEAKTTTHTVATLSDEWHIAPTKDKNGEQAATHYVYDATNKSVTLTYVDGEGNPIGQDKAKAVIDLSALADTIKNYGFNATAGGNLAKNGEQAGTATATAVESGKTVTFAAGKNLNVKQDIDAKNKDHTYTFALDTELTDLSKVTVGKDGKDGVDGQIGVNGKDGASVVINGKDGSIGLTGPKGKDGTNGATTTITVATGRDGKDGAPGTKGLDGTITTRIEYKDGNNTHTVATLDDGQKYGGDNYVAATKTEAEKNVIAKKLNERLDIIGGAEATKLTDKNIGVNNVDGKLKVQLAKNLTDIDTITVGKDGKDGVNGTIIVKGKDGAGVQINGEDGTIGLDGRDGKNGLTIAGDKGAAGVDGTDGANGKDGMTRIVYTDNNNTTHEVATLDDGLKFTGNNSDTTNIHKLNSLVTIEGEGVDKEASKAFKSASGNINVVADGTSKLTVQLSKNLTGLDTIDVNTVTVGKDGKDGVNGTIIVKGKDGAGVQINGEDGTIGLDGRDGKNGLTIAGDKGAAGVDGTDGANGKDGMTRIVYTDNNNTTHEVATLDDGMKYAGDDAQGTDKSKVLIKKLNNTVDIVGGADKDKLTDKNIGVNNVDGKLKVQLAKNLTDIDTITVGKDGKDGVNGTIIVKGKDGAGVQINGEDGTIGLDGRDGKNGLTIAGDKGAAGVDGTDGANGKDGMTRIVYTDNNNTTHEVATLDDGLKFTGNNSDTTNIHKLNSLVTIEGEGVDKEASKAFKSASGNINVVADGTSKLTVQLSKNLTGLDSIDVNTVTVGKDGKDGVNGTIIVKGKDGAGVQINGEDGTIGLDGRDGKNGLTIAGDKGAAGVDGTDGANGKDGMTRIVYTDNNNTTHEVATLDDGMKYAGDDGQTDTTKVLIKKLNNTVDIVGGADKDKLTDNNIGVNNVDGKLKVQLAKNIDLGNDGSVKTGNTTMNNGGVTVDDGNGNSTTITINGTTVKAGDISTTTTAGATTYKDGDKVVTVDTNGTTIVDGDNVVTHTAEESTYKNGDGSTTITAGNATFTDGKTSTILGPNGVTITPSNGSELSVSLTDNGLNNGGNKITNVAKGTDDTDAVNVSQLKDFNKDITEKGLNFAANSGDVSHRNLGETLTIKGEGTKEDKNYSGENLKTMSDGKGNITIKMDKDITTNSVTTNTVTVGKDGKDGVNGTIIVKGKDGAGVQINGEDGTIGLDGRNGKDGLTIAGDKGAAGVDGTDGANGKDGMTRIVYTDNNNTTHEVATLDDGLKFTGNNSDTTNIHKLNSLVTIEGEGVDKEASKAFKSASGNINVVADGTSKLTVQLSKNLTGLDTIDVNTVTVGKDGKDGVNGTIIVKGKDGAGVQINGEDGTIGLDGRDGKNGLTIAGDKGAAGVDGTDGANGKDGMTRIVYTDNNNTTHEVATLDDGMKYAGDDAQGTDKSKVLIKKLNNTVDIVGGADKDKLTDNNIGVNNVDGKLKVQLSKELKDLSSAQFKDKNGNTTEVTGEGMTITDGNNHVVIHDANGTLMSDGKNSSLSTANGYSVMDDKGNVAEFSAGGTTISDGKGNSSLHSAGNSIFTNGDVSTIVGPNGVTITPSNGSGAEVTLTDKGLNNGGNKITNVAEGTEDTDAVNVSQLEKAKKAATTTITVNDNNTAKNWNLNLKESKAEDGHINYDISLADVVTLGEGANRVKLDGLNGQVTLGEGANRVKLDGLKGQVIAGGILIGDQITVSNHAQPKEQKGNFITGLENKTWNPKTDGIVSGRAATEDQLKIVSDKANQVAENTIGFTGDNKSATDKQALSKDGGISFNIAGGADKDNLSDNNIGVNAKGSTVEVKLAKDLKGLNSAEFTDGKGNTTKINSEGTVITDGKNTARSTASGYTVTDGTNSTTMTSNGIVINPSNGDSKASVSLTNNGLHNGGNKITGVAAGDISPTSTDAVNGSQLYKTTQEFSTKGMNFAGNDKQSIHKNLGDTMNIIGGGEKDNKEYDASNVKTFKDDKGNLVIGLDKNLKAETITTKTVTTETVNTKEVKTDSLTINGRDGKDGVTIKGETGKDGETRIVYTDGKDGKDGKSHTVATLDDGMKFAGDDKKVIDKKLGEQLDIHGGADANNLTDNNIGVVSDNKALKVKLAKNIKGVDSISKGEGKGGITLQDKGVRIDGGDLDMSNHKVTNVAPGRVAADSKDAVNGSQLHATNQVVINNARNIAALDNKINHVDRNLRAGIAGALASGGLYQANTPGKSMVSAGVGTYKGESAVAVGYSRMSDNGKIGIKFSVNSNTRGDNGAAASVGYQW